MMHTYTALRSAFKALTVVLAICLQGSLFAQSALVTVSPITVNPTPAVAGQKVYVTLDCNTGASTPYFVQSAAASWSGSTLNISVSKGYNSTFADPDFEPFTKTFAINSLNTGTYTVKVWDNGSLLKTSTFEVISSNSSAACMATNSFADHICEDFGAYVPNQKLAPQSSAWTTFFGDDNSSSGATIVGDGSARMMLVNYSVTGGIQNQNAIMRLGDRTQGAYSFSFGIRVGAAQKGMVKLFHKYVPVYGPSEQEVGMTLTFNNGLGELNYGGQLIAFTYSVSQFTTFSLFMDLDNNLMRIYRGTNVMAQWPFNLKDNGLPGTKQLSAIEFGGLFDNKFYVDNINFDAYGSGCMNMSTITLIGSTNNAPVCGCNGLTYNNSITAKAYGVGSWTNGACNQTSSCTDDGFEASGNNYANAIDFTTSKDGAICPAGDYDYFVFQTDNANPYVKVSLTNLPADYDVSLYAFNNTNGQISLLSTSENSGTTAETIKYNGTSTGRWYVVKVYGYNNATHATAKYRLNVYKNAYPYSSISDAGSSKKDQSEQQSEVADRSDISITYDASLLSETAQPANVELAAAPNPFQTETTLRFDLTEESTVSLQVLDLTGRIIETLIDVAPMSSGSQEVTFSANNLPSGIYLAMLNVNGQKTTQRLVVQR